MCRNEISQAIASNQVVLVAGETGCGKTTQVPQFLLEDAWGGSLAVILLVWMHSSLPCIIHSTQHKTSHILLVQFHRELDVIEHSVLYIDKTLAR